MANDIFIFGDSIAYGAFDPEIGGWVNRIRLYLENKGNFKDAIYNFGISGDTTRDVISRFDCGINRLKPGLIVFAIGVNDSLYLPSRKDNFVPINQFRENISELINKASKFTNNIVFIGLAPVDENKTNPVSWIEEGDFYTNDEIKKYNSAIKEECNKNNLKFIEMLDAFLNAGYKNMLDEDGVHPNSKGHEWMAKKIIKELNF